MPVGSITRLLGGEIWWLLASDKIRVKFGKRRELCDNSGGLYLQINRWCWSIHCRGRHFLRKRRDLTGGAYAAQ
jgi:hypothetical protein